MRKVVDAYDDLKEEIDEWEEANLVDLQNNEDFPEPNEALKQAAEKYKEIINSNLTEEEQKEAVDELIKDDHDARLEISNQIINDMVESNLTQEEIDDIEAQRQAIINDEYLSSYKKRKMLENL